ncbi:uncharacterized protein LOC110177974 [Drosophila serrata]|uniref:uncharacterized protein LOC110177974 n=1 Tax=Drosophila serrata TaxID=7274 RepID=UPI000A1D22FF|nr:uncharacterized protein LOC110177974 [Drosophila serrata]
MPMLLRNLPMMRQMRMLATKSRLEKNNAIPKAKSWKQDWPVREENFAAVQIHQQKQPVRSMSHRPISMVDMGAFRPVTLPDQAYAPGLTNRNNMAAAQNASKGRTIRAQEQMERRMDYQGRRQDTMNADEAEFDPQQQDYGMERRPDMRLGEDQDFDSDLEVRSVREAVFGTQDDSDEDEKLRAQADAELLRRVTAQKVDEPPTQTISRKVIQPYMSYRNHRTRWAEFRHSMIYGRSSF